MASTAPVVTYRQGLRPGDLGWVIWRHGSVYGTEYGWTTEFDLLVAEIATAFAREHNPERESCWFAEVNGRTAGCVFLVERSPEVAKLRLLIVDAEARGLGIGKELVQRCIAFARDAGYSSITLWTNSILLAARGIYEAFGFVMTESEPYHAFGHDLVSETWELTL